MATSGEDSGYAWVVCAASFMVLLNVGGFVYTTGIFYIMFQNGLEAGDTALALITSLNISFHYLVCPVAGLLSERYGERCIAMLGAAVATFGYAMSSLTTEVYQLYFTFGITAGIGMGMAFNTSVSILSKYFIKHTRTACGLAMCGLGVGSFIYPPIMESLEDTYGWRGAILMMAGISAHSLVFCALYRPLAVEKRIKQSIMASECISSGTNNEENNTNTSTAENTDLNVDQIMSIKTKDKVPVNYIKQILSLFKVIPFVFLNLHTLVLYFAVPIVYTHLGSYVLTLSFSKHNVVHLYMVMGITSTIARPLTGFLAQVTRVNTSTVLMISAVLQGICTLTLPLMDNLNLMYMYAVVIQILMTQYNILCPTIVADTVPRSQVPSGYGIVCFFGVPGTVLGPPLAAFVYDSTNVYAHSFYMTGVLFLVAGLLMVPAAWSVHKHNKGLPELAVNRKP